MYTTYGRWIISALCIASIYGCGSKKQSTDAKNVFGPDSRETLDIAKFPGKAVARLDGGCSAAIIGRKLALTAAHCVYDSAKSVFKSDVKYLKSGYKDGISVADSWISQVWLGSLSPEKERKNDWAILGLSDDIGSITGWFGVNKQELESTLPLTVNLAGYGTDKNSGQVPQITRNCYLHKVDESGRVLHDCDGVTGVSGGPIFTFNDKEAYIVAMTAAEFRSGDQSMKLDSYSHDYANIAVNSNAFASTVEQLKNSIDTGLTAPDLPNVFHFSNLNSSLGDPNNGDKDPDDKQDDPKQDDGKKDNDIKDPNPRQEDPAPNDPNPRQEEPQPEPDPNPRQEEPKPEPEPEPEPDPDPTLLAGEQREKLEVQISTYSLSIFNASQIIINAAVAVLNYADYYAYQDLWHKTDDMAQIATRLADSAWQLRYLQTTRELGIDAILDNSERLTSAVSGLNACVEINRNTAYISRDLKAPLQDIECQIELINRYTTL